VAGNKILEVYTLKRFIFLSLSSLLLLILMPGCFTIQVPPTTTPASGTPPVIGVFSNNPSAINSGGTSTLLWDVTGANSVSIDQGIGQVSAAGIKVISPVASTVYTISATNSAGTVTRSATTTVNQAIQPAGTPPVIIVFSDIPATGSSDGTSTLLWNVTGANWVSIDQGIGQVNAAGTRVISPGMSTVYTLTAANSAGTVTRSASAAVNPALVPFAVTSVVGSAEPSTFTGPCPKTFTFYATITVNGPGTVTYRWERNDGAYSDTQSINFDAAGAKTTTLQWDLGGSASGWHRIHVLTPYDAASNPVYYTLNCGTATGSPVTGVIVGVDQYPYTGPCPKTIHFWGTITVNGPCTVTYRWERSDGSQSASPETIAFTGAGSQTVANLWTRGEGTGWQRLHILTPNDTVSSQVDFVMTCWNQTQ
jgi:hypothetical protein